jgi:hypothetical protein
MGALVVIVGDELRHGPSEVALTKQDDSVEALRLDRPAKPLRMRIRIRGSVGCLDQSLVVSHPVFRMPAAIPLTVTINAA